MASNDQGPQEYLLVTFLVTRDGEQGHPMDAIVKRVDLTAGGQPVDVARLTEAIVREITRRGKGTSDGQV